MSRYAFIQDTEYAAELYDVTERPVENKDLALVRLEFEIFAFLEERLVSTGRIACRDIIVGAVAGIKADTAVRRFNAALAVGSPDTADRWLALKLGKPRPWVKIVFGTVNQSDERNPFDSICQFDPAGFKITRPPPVVGWVKVSAAARALRTSDSTVRRMIQRYEGEFGPRLVRRTPSGYRWINIRLLRNLGDY